MQDLLVLGKIPGTHVQITFGMWLIIAGVCLGVFLIHKTPPIRVITRPIGDALGISMEYFGMFISWFILQVAIILIAFVYPFIKKYTPELISYCQFVGESFMALCTRLYELGRNKLLEKLEQ